MCVCVNLLILTIWTQNPDHGTIPHLRRELSKVLICWRAASGLSVPYTTIIPYPRPLSITACPQTYASPMHPPCIPASPIPYAEFHIQAAHTFEFSYPHPLSPYIIHIQLQCIHTYTSRHTYTSSEMHGHTQVPEENTVHDHAVREFFEFYTDAVHFRTAIYFLHISKAGAQSPLCSIDSMHSDCFPLMSHYLLRATHAPIDSILHPHHT